MNDTLIREIASFTLDTRGRLEQEADEQLQGLYGWLKDGSFVDAARCPAVKALDEARETRRRLEQFAADEAAAGLTAPDARKKLLRETAFTWLNRLVAFRLLEERKLIKQTISKLADSNAFKFWLVEDASAAAYAEYQKGDMPKNAMDEGPSQTAYRQFLLAQCTSLAAEVSILFDPINLASRLCPRPGLLKELVASIDAAGLADAWKPGNEETLGWIYQFFVEKRKKEVFDGFSKGKKVTPEDIGPATQLFTPRWIVRALVENSVGRYWLDMHPDSKFAASLEYLVPLPEDRPSVPLKPVREITFVDPACGTMHFGLVAFDLFVEMYREELANAGKGGWPAKPSASSDGEIASSIIGYNLHGIDIDLRAVQIAALALLLRAKSLHKECTVTDRNIAAGNVESVTGSRMEELINATQFGNRAEERILRSLAAKVADSPTLGSLLRLESDLISLVEAERKKLVASSQPELLLAGLTDDLFTSTRDLDAFFDQLAESIAARLDTFARDAHSASSHTAGEAAKGMRFLRIIQQRYDIVAGNPPYMSTRNQSEVMREYFKGTYPNSKTDLYAVFIERANELVAPYGRLAFITQQSFMFISSYEKLRQVLRDTVAVENMIHVGTRAFASISGEKVNTTLLVFRKEPNKMAREKNRGLYFRLVHERDADAKRIAFEGAIKRLRSGEFNSQVYTCQQADFDAILGKPWVYWFSASLRSLFKQLKKVGDVATTAVGQNTGDNFRFLRFWWEVGPIRVRRDCTRLADAIASKGTWFPYMKGGTPVAWWGNQSYCVNWGNDGNEVKALAVIRNKGKHWSRYLQNLEFLFRSGLTWSDVSSKGFAVRLSPGGFIHDVKGMGCYPRGASQEVLLGLLNSRIAAFLLAGLNPTISYQAGDVRRLPVPNEAGDEFVSSVRSALNLSISKSSEAEDNHDFRQPPISIEALVLRDCETARLDSEIDAEVSRVYNLSDADLALIQQEFAAAPAVNSETDGAESESGEGDADAEEQSGSVNWSEQTLAQAWISYSAGTVLGRHAIGEPDGLGRGDFNAPTLAAIRALIDPNGVMVAEKDHPQDIVRRTVQCLEAMRGRETAHALIRTAAGKTSGDPEELLRDWLTHFTGPPAASFWKYHHQLYRKRPIYWPLQSPKKHFTVWVFHERFGPTTLFTVQQLADDQRRLIGRELPALSALAATNKAAGKKRDDILEATEDLQEFSNRLKNIADRGYTFCIDDGVLLNAAPLHSLLPSWPETKKAWQELESEKYEWAQQAMKHWPDRVKEACKTNKSFAIAHGLA